MADDGPLRAAASSTFVFFVLLLMREGYWLATSLNAYSFCNAMPQRMLAFSCFCGISFRHYEWFHGYYFQRIFLGPRSKALDRRDMDEGYFGRWMQKSTFFALRISIFLDHF